jgi:hypothetical protein
MWLLGDESEGIIFPPWGEMSPLGTAATVWPVVPAPDNR